MTTTPEHYSIKNRRDLASTTKQAVEALRELGEPVPSSNADRTTRFPYKTSGKVRYDIVKDDALISLSHINWSIENFNADDSSFSDHKDVTLADVTVEFTRIANGGHDPRPINERAAGIAQDVMADFIHALEEAVEAAQ